MAQLARADRTLQVPSQRTPDDTCLRTAIVDANALERERVRRLLEVAPDVEIVGAGLTQDDAVALAARIAPDLMFVAIRDPHLNGLAAMSAIPHERRPGIVVIAECEDYAFQAFETQAIDYLLIPFTDRRFEQSLSRARRMLHHASAERAEWVAGSPSAAVGERRLIVRTSRHLTFIPLCDIDWVESAGNYVRVHAGRETHLVRETMTSIEVRLDERFVRIHRTAIVNADRIRRITNDECGHRLVLLKDGTQIPAGRFIEGQLRDWMNSAC